MPLLDVILGYDCNLACDYCTITEEMRARSLPASRVASELSRARRDGWERVSFTGGEPTIRADLLPLVRQARRLGYTDIKVQSNGLLFAHPPNVDRLIAAGCNRFHVSIHTHDADAYDALVRRQGAYPLMVRGLDNVVAAGEHLTVDVIMKEDTYRMLPAAIDWLHGRGVRSVHLWFVSLTDGNRDAISSMPPMTDVVPFMHEAFSRAAALGAMEIRSLHVPRCLLGSHAARALDPAAEHVRVVTPEATFDLAESKLTGTMHVPACGGCEHESYCPGLRPDYVEVYGDAEVATARGRPAEIVATRRLPVVGR